MATRQEALDRRQPTHLADLVGDMNTGSVFAGLVPRPVVRTGLTSGATHVHSVPGAILAVTSSADAPQAMIAEGAPAANQVRVEYDANGLATLTFNGAVTGYKVLQMALPAGHGDRLAASHGGAA